MESKVLTNEAGHDGRIVARMVTDHVERMRCLPEVAGGDYLLLEHTVYNMLGMICKHYDGGVWDYYKLSNGGVYMAPDRMGDFELLVPGNGFEGIVDAECAGLIATAMAYSHLSFDIPGDCFPRAFVQLSKFIYQHRYAGAMFAALD